MFQHALFMHPSACFPCPQNTSIFSTFLNSQKHKHTLKESGEPLFQCLSLSLSSGIVGQSAKHSRFGCNHLQLKFNEMETDTEFFFFAIDARTHPAPPHHPRRRIDRLAWSVCLTAPSFFFVCLFFEKPLYAPQKTSRPDPHTCTPRSSACIPAHARQHAAHDLPLASLCC